MSNPIDRLKFFTSVRVTEDHRDSLQDMEALLQIEHNPDGKHPIASSAQHGFMSAQDKQRLDEVYTYLKKLGVV